MMLADRGAAHRLSELAANPAGVGSGVGANRSRMAAFGLVRG